MIQFTLQDLHTWIGLFLWPLFRVASFFAVAPIFGESAVPVPVKVGCSVVISLAITPMIGPIPTIPPYSFAALGTIAEQVLIGLALGLTMKFVFAAVQVAGELTGLQMGLSFASFFDPSSGGNTSVMSRLMNAFAILLFVSVNGHLLLVSGLARTFDLIPIGLVGVRLDDSGISALLQFSGQIFISGMLIALPMLFALLTINLAMGILNRTAQQLSVFAVGFPITLTVSLGLLTIVMPHMDGLFDAVFMRGFTAMSDLAKGLSAP